MPFQFIAKLTGRSDKDVGVGHGMASGTTEVRGFPTNERINGKRVVVVDAPGAGSADLSDVQMLDKLALCLGPRSEHHKANGNYV